MSYYNTLTPQQLRNFKRRARFTACGEPADVFAEPMNAVLFVTINRNTETGDAWHEGTPYRETYRNTYRGDTEELSPWYVSKLRKVPEATARRIISRELHHWAKLPAGTVSGYTPAQIEAEADRIARG